ncbi:MAG: hypothetical protein AAFR83_19760 [Cyanobacteria bacterium J06629_18]
MKNLLRNSLIASVVAVAGVVSGAGVSFAGSATLNLSSTVPGSCSFVDNDNDNDNAVYTNNEGALRENTTYESIYWSGTFPVLCNHGDKVNITVNSVNPSGKADTNRDESSYHGEYFKVNGNVIWANGIYINSILPPENYDTGRLSYEFFVANKNGTDHTGLLPGDYSYTIQMTVTPG